jgi:hypothetical protein
VQSSADGSDRQIAVAEPAHHVEGLARGLFHREPCRVALHVALDGFAHLRRRSKVAVRRDEPTDALVRPLKVVRVDEQLQPSLEVFPVREDGPREELVPQRLPEALDLAERLRMLRSALDVVDAFSTKLLLELRRTAPRRVLPAVVGEDLPRRAVGGDALAQSLHHECAPLVVRDRVRHDEARVVVHERGHVDALVPPEQEREDVRLPELVRFRALEAPLPRLAQHPLGLLLEQTLLVEDSPHRGLRNAECLEAFEEVADLARAKLGSLSLERHHRASLRVTRRGLRCHGFGPLHRHERVHAPLAVLAHPERQCRVRHPEPPRDGVRRRAVVRDLPRRSDLQLERVLSRSIARGDRLRRRA